jgi:hypothetical protein
VTLQPTQQDDEPLGSPFDDPLSTSPRHMGPRPRPPPIISLTSITGRRRNDDTTQPEIPQLKTERTIQIGEGIRVAVVVRMPFDQTGQKSTRLSTQDDEDEEEGTGWEVGMELGVWEGFVGDEPFRNIEQARWGG